MMINCPNCNLLQPKDQYCAGCGINIDTWKPPEAPAWKKLLSNWMFQLTLLFLVILAIVLKDSLGQKNIKNEVQNVAPVAQSIPRTETLSLQEEPVNEPTQAPTENLKKETIKSLSKDEVKSKGVSQVVSAELKKIANLKISVMTQQMIFQITEKAQKIEENAFLITQTELKKILANNKNKDAIKSFGNLSSDFTFNKEKVLFVGEEDLDTGLKVGLFTMITVVPHNPDKQVQYDFSYWPQLNLNGEPQNRVHFDVALPLESALVFIDPNLNEMRFNKEERTLFESSDRLNKLNGEAFQEGLSDIVLVLEIK